MVSIQELKGIYVLGKLTESMLEKIRPLAQLQIFGDGAVIFREDQEAEYFYMMVKGKLLLETEISESILISLGAIKTGYSFGWSAMLPGSSYTASAVCVEPCEVIAIRGSEFLKVLEEDHSIGYLVMEGVVKVLKRRLERRTGQFLEALRNHPDLQSLFKI